MNLFFLFFLLLLFSVNQYAADVENDIINFYKSLDVAVEFPSYEGSDVFDEDTCVGLAIRNKSSFSNVFIDLMALEHRMRIEFDVVYEGGEGGFSSFTIFSLNPPAEKLVTYSEDRTFELCSMMEKIGMALDEVFRQQDVSIEEVKSIVFKIGFDGLFAFEGSDQRATFYSDPIQLDKRFALFLKRKFPMSKQSEVNGLELLPMVK